MWAPMAADPPCCVLLCLVGHLLQSWQILDDEDTVDPQFITVDRVLASTDACMEAHPSAAEALAQWEAAYAHAVEVGLTGAEPDAAAEAASAAGEELPASHLRMLGAGVQSVRTVKGFALPFKNGAPVAPPPLMYLVKWCGLSYAESTWETPETLNSDQKIWEYRLRSVGCVVYPALRRCPVRVCVSAVRGRSRGASCAATPQCG